MKGPDSGTIYGSSDNFVAALKENGEVASVSYFGGQEHDVGVPKMSKMKSGKVVISSIVGGNFHFGNSIKEISKGRKWVIFTLKKDRAFAAMSAFPIADKCEISSLAGGLKEELYVTGKTCHWFEFGTKTLQLEHKDIFLLRLLSY